MRTMKIIQLLPFCILMWLLSTYSAAIGTEHTKTVELEQLGGSERYLVYVSTDKPIYQENESLYLRAVFLNAADNTPVSASQVGLSVKILGPNGDTVFEQYGQGDDSTAGISWLVPEGTPGGQYTAKVSSPSLGTPEVERVFEIRAYRAPRIKSQIEFVRDGYGVGDLLQAAVKLERSEGGIPEGAKVTALARLDGHEVFRQSGLSVPANGTLSIQFELPETIHIGDGTLSFIVEDGGNIETASKTLPILLQNMSLVFYPEGGDLIAGLSNRVYLQAYRPDGKPADIQGRVVELINGKPAANTLATVSTQHEGRGLFTFTPQAKKNYALVLDSPSGITRHFDLPVAQTGGVVISSTQSVYDYNENIAVTVTSNGKIRPASLTLHKREVLVATTNMNSSAKNTAKTETIVLNADDSEGVLILTAWDNNGNALAERLVYRKPRFALNIDLSVSKGSFVPGGDIELNVVTSDENGNPVEAVVGLTVTDDTVLEMIDNRDKAPRLPVMVYLEHEVEDLADASIYLDSSDSDAPLSLDLLLGTQGWRRFILVQYEQIKSDHPDAAKRALAERMPQQVAIPRVALQAADVMFDEAVQAFAVEAQIEPEEQQIKGDNVDKKERRVERKAAINVAAEIPAAGLMMEADDAIIARRQRLPQPVAQIREYAYQVRPNRKANERADFTETLYWHKGIRTSARNGKATIKFGLSDSVTSFRIMGDAFGRNGAIGSNDLVINSVEPFFIEPKLPLAATVGDTIEVPVTLVNSTEDTLKAARIVVKADSLQVSQPSSVTLKPGDRVRQLVIIKATQAGRFPLSVVAAAGAYTDSVTRTLTIKPAGFPVQINHGGLLAPTAAFSTEIVIPTQIEPGSVTAVAKVYPSPLASMEEALNALLRQPNGCFEQTSSSNYPLIMAQQYFTSHHGIGPEKITQTRDLLEVGYKKLISFESQDNGYEWFGANPAHESLTAYGLMQFVDMAKVMLVDDAMIERTRQWLLARRDGKGGFKRNQTALDSFGGAPAPTTDAYIVWALLESGEDPTQLKQEIAAIKAHALSTTDNYTVALSANILHLAGDKQGATELSTKLDAAANSEGAIEGAETSITRSGGDALTIETTSLAVLAWLKDDTRWAAQVETSMKWLFERSKAGRFGSTQSTILALKAINTYDAARAVPKKPGSVQLLLDGEAFGKPVTFDKTSKGAIELPDFSAALSSGMHTIALAMQDGSKMPFALEISYNTALPVSSDINPIRIETQLSHREIEEGELVELNLVLTVGDKDAPTPIAIVGIPAGLEVRHTQLKELVDAARISAYEVLGRELILYWRELKAAEQRSIALSLEAAVPGEYTAPASRTYLYYTDEHKHWISGETISIKARG